MSLLTEMMPVELHRAMIPANAREATAYLSSSFFHCSKVSAEVLIKSSSHNNPFDFKEMQNEDIIDTASFAVVTISGSSLET